MSGDCKWPGCGELASRQGWGCPTHWGRLPVKIRQALGHSYQPGRPADVYRLRAEGTAREFIVREATRTAKARKGKAGDADPLV